MQGVLCRILIVDIYLIFGILSLSTTHIEEEKMYQAIKHSNNNKMWLVINQSTNQLDSIKDTRKKAQQRAEELNKQASQ